jgi:two-component system CheB/CheR fusion protein
MTDTTDHEPSEPRPRPSGDKRVLVVAIAGTDVAAIERLASELPTGRGMAFVITLAATPTPRHLNVGRLQDRAASSVRELETTLPLQPETIYVAQQGVFVTVGPDEVCVGPPEAAVPPLDHLFRSLAQHHAERASAILLSGIRSDGGIGAAELKAAGGLVILQVPANTAEASLPEQQLLGKGADLVLPLPRITSALADYFRAEADHSRTKWATTFDHDTLAPILAVLNQSTGHEFSGCTGCRKQRITSSCSGHAPPRRSSCSTRC